MFRCTTDRYDELYARWLGKPGLLLDLAEYEPHYHLLDLCGGSGAVSREALRRGGQPHRIVLYDLNPRCPDPRIPCIQENVDDHARDKTVRGMYGVPFDVVVLRQAANYLRWDSDLVSWLRYLLVPGGKFVFNTFTHPMEGGVKPYSYKSYRFGGHRFFEAHLYVPPLDELLNMFSEPDLSLKKLVHYPEDIGPMRGRVLHLQAKLSGRLGFDITKFRHLDPDSLLFLLTPCFKVEVQEEGRSLRWVCTKHLPRMVG